MKLLSALSILGIALLVTCSDAQAVDLEFDKGFENSDTQAAVQQWSNDALAQLPPSLHERFSGKIRVRFKSWGKSGPLKTPYCTGGPARDDKSNGSKFETYGRYNALRNIITLNSRLLDEIQLGPEGSRNFDCYHGNFYRLATATLLHEIAHAYDALDLDTSTGKSARRSRLSHTTVSSDPAWTVVDGLHTRLLGFRFSTSKNRDLDRLPSAHAAKNKRESFAAHFEYFLLDADYSCRYPSHQEYLQNHFGWAPSRSDCRSSYEVVARQGTDLADLDPERIYQVRYLLAAPGQKAVSRLGHSMLHFVLCAPGTTRGPECLEQEEEDIVLGFAALTDDSSWRWLKGMIGSYDSMVFFTSLKHQLQKYNHLEMRDAVSYSIDLSREQIRRLTNRAIELYWTYRGPYRFFSMNCATETEDLLKASILDEGYIYGKRRTPKGVLKRLQETGIASQTQAPWVYESDFDFGSRAIVAIYGVAKPRNRKTLFRQIDKLSFEQRRDALSQMQSKLAALGDTDQDGSSADTLDATMQQTQLLGKQLESFRFLEGIIVHKQDKRLASAGIRRLQKLAKRDGNDTELLERFRYLALTMQNGDRDSWSGYGIPLVGEIGPDRAELARELDVLSLRIFSTDHQSTRFAKWEKEKTESESLAAGRYRLLRAYVDIAREVRTAITRQAVARNPQHSNSAIRSLLEVRYGAGSFAATRFSDARINRLRQAGELIAWETSEPSTPLGVPLLQ